MTGSKSTIKNGKKYCLFFIKYQFKVFFFQHVSCTYSLSDFFFFFSAYLIYLSIVLWTGSMGYLLTGPQTTPINPSKDHPLQIK